VIPSPPAPRTAAALLLSGLALLLLGCGGASKTAAPGVLPSAFPDHSADEIRAAIVQPTDTLRRFSAEARVTVQSPDENRSFNADIRQERADSLFMRFSLFGFEGGRMLMTPDSVFIYDRRDGTVRIGPVAEAQQFLPAPVASDQVFANLLGVVAPPSSPDWTLRADSTRYYLSSPTGSETWTVDPRRWRVVRYERRASDGDLLEVRRFSDFRLVKGVPLPHSVTFRRPPDDLSAHLTYRSITLNPTGLSFSLGVPSNVPRKPIRGR
jgi:outer membrane lipoprotein-sorting protein